MSQFDPVIGADKSGLAYRQDDNNGKKAIMTHHKGATAPAYAEAGISWLDDSASPWALKLYDGTDWITVGEIDASETVKGLVERARHYVAEYFLRTQYQLFPEYQPDRTGRCGVFR